MFENYLRCHYASLSSLLSIKIFQDLRLYVNGMPETASIIIVSVLKVTLPLLQGRGKI